MNLKFIENKDIDLYKWDTCIHSSINGLPYAYSWYLNIVSDNWKALIMNDYEACMPLLEKRFLSIMPYIHTEVMIPQLGIFANRLLSNTTKEQFFLKLAKHYYLAHIDLDKFSFIANSRFNCNTSDKYELDLIHPYDRILKKYKPGLHKKLENAKNNKITVVRGLMPNDLIRLISRKYFKVNQLFKVSLRILASTALRYKVGQIYGAYTKYNTICAAIFFIKSNKKAIMLVSAFTKEAIKYNAIELMIDHYLRTNSESDLTFVFENIGHRHTYIKQPEFDAKKMKYYTVSLKNIF